MSTNGSLLEMVLESHIKIKSISAVPEADADERAATCGQTRTLHFSRSDRERILHTQHRYIHTLTVVILYAQHKVSAGVADRLHREARVLLHRCLRKQLPCRTGGQMTATNATRSTIPLTCFFFVRDGNR